MPLLSHHAPAFSRVTFIIIVTSMTGALPVFAAKPRFEVLRKYSAAEANQGVAVDGSAFYAIANTTIARYDRKSGKRLALWKSTRAHRLIHLNHGIVRQGKLYCAHSNSPGVPATSSLEIFDAKTLKHVGTHSFGIYEGSLTWIDRHDNAWWAVFAHYSDKALRGGGKTTKWTSLVKFDDKWRRLQAWVFPKTVIAKFEPYSCSGGGWGPDGRLYVSGHDAGELYVLTLPKAGSVLRHVETIPMPITGQAFAWDKSQPGVLFGINRPKKQVIAVKLRR